MGGNSSRGWYRPDHSKTASDGPGIYIAIRSVMCGQLTEELVFIIKQKVIKNPVTDLFQQLKSIKKKPICLFSTRKQCHHFLITMLGHLTSEIHEIPCIDKVDETMSTTKQPNTPNTCLLYTSDAADE